LVGGTYNVSMGDRGRLLIPAPLRQRKGWTEGSTLIAMDADRGVVLVDREELKRIVREQLADADLVGELLAERRRAASDEDLAG
jgi:bifunctional DNA-binding transcriptional regulator/antitoxin component of YhaV-PrlF toxin-antitoxin module